MAPLRDLLRPVFDHPAFRAARSALEGGGPEISLSGLTPTAKSVVVAGLAHELRRPLVVFTRDNETADRLRQTTSTFLAWIEGVAARAAVSVFPAFDCLPYEGRSPHAEILERRAVALWDLAQGRARIHFVPLPAALGRFRERSYYSSLALELKVGDELNFQDLADHLAGVGYETGEPVSNVGQFSVRGGIVDVYASEAEWPFRIEFFGDRIDSLREFDPATQRSRKPAPRVLLLPLVETRRSPRFFDDLVRTLAARGSKKHSPEAEPDWAPAYSGPFAGWEFFVPLVEPHRNTLMSLLDRPVVVWDEPGERNEQLKRTLESCAAAYDEIRDMIPPRPRPEDILLTEAEFCKSLATAPALSLRELAIEAESVIRPPALVGEGWHLSRHGRDGPPEGGQSPPLASRLVLQTQPAPKFHGGLKALVEDLRQRLERRERVVAVLPSAGIAERVREILNEYELPLDHATEAPGEAKGTDHEKAGSDPAAVLIARGELEQGVAFPDLRLLLLADSDLFGDFAWGSAGRRDRSRVASFLSDLSDLKVGDYVVHVDHGIGLYQGLRQLDVERAPRDFMLLTYQDGARLYVPLERLDLVEKYRASGDGAKPPLDRLGGSTWARTQTRVKRALRDMAQELLGLYANRKINAGVSYSPDSPWQKEFEDAFEFEETADQSASLTEIKRDLESPQPMDRLLCGDVGYGKTELAMRVAFKVVQDSKQVAVLAPTTVLAFQHFTTFRQRLAPFPVRIEMLSRFRSAAEQKKILGDTESGKVDVLIGTHRMLSRDVHFRDLGLLIVDEEQRFGVAGKEKLRKFKASVDVLSMSATPIPRTLHMALGGLRDLSVIETPPRGRLAIQTTVAPFNQALIQAAILQEKERQGQVYFVHNRVESIFSMAALIQRLVPTARLGVAHGQIGEKELEKVIMKFMQGEYDVLVSTALIENGLDIPLANTILVNHADRFGLADLYQLRGRVGRSNRRAYAYFLIPAEETLTPTARRRLAALKEFSTLGAGFRLAALDLELRGAGNLLGAEQSGHLNAIGIDLYLKMLEETLGELKGATPKPEVRTTLNLGLDIKIPDRYIADESQRLRMYKRISGLATREARAELEAELMDRYGPIPESVTTLLRYALLKSEAERLLVQSIERKADEILMRFHDKAPVNPEKLKQFIRRHKDASFRPDGLLRFRPAVRDGDFLEQIQNVLRELHA